MSQPQQKTYAPSSLRISLERQHGDFLGLLWQITKTWWLKTAGFYSHLEARCPQKAKIQVWPGWLFLEVQGENLFLAFSSF